MLQGAANKGAPGAPFPLSEKMTRISRETVTSALTGLQSLAEDHWNEISADRSATGMGIDWDRYLAMEAAGLLELITARHDGKLIGYAAFLCTPSIHHEGTILCACSAIYVAPQHRGFVGGRLLVEAEAILRSARLGDNRALMILHRVTPQADFGASLRRVGYVTEEVVFSKWVT